MSVLDGINADIATLTPYNPTPLGVAGYGQDISGLTGVTDWRLMIEGELLKQQAYRRITTARGSYYASFTYGIDIQEFLHSKLSDADMTSQIVAEIKKDDRIADVKVTLTKSLGVYTFDIALLPKSLLFAGITLYLQARIDDESTSGEVFDSSQYKTGAGVISVGGFAEGISVASFAPLGILTQGNFESSLNLAILSIPTRAAGGCVIIPKPPIGDTAWFMTNGIRLRSLGFGESSWLIGETPGIRLQWPNGFSGRCVEVDGSLLYDGSASPGFFKGGIANLEFISNGGSPTILWMRNILNPLFDTVVCGGASASGGKGMVITSTGGAVNQNIDFSKCYFGGNFTGSEVSICNTLNFKSCSWDNNSAHQLILQTVVASFEGECMWQNGGPAAIEANDIVIHIEGTPYCENMGTAVVRTTAWSSGTRLGVYISGLSLAAVSGAKVVDVVGGLDSHISIKNVLFIGGERPLLQATGGLTSVVIEGHGGPIEAPLSYNIDRVTAANTVAYSRGAVESGYESNAKSVEAMLWPYLLDGIDPNKFANYTLSGSNFVSGVGVKGGTIAHAFSGTDVQLLGPSISSPGNRFVQAAAGKSLTITFGAALPVGSNPGMFCVFRRPVSANINGPAMYDNGTFLNQLGIGLPASGNIGLQWQAGGVNRLQASTVPVGSDIHAVLVLQRSVNHLEDGFVTIFADYKDPVVYPSSNVDSTAAITTGLMGDVASYECFGVWYLNKAMPEGVSRQLMALACDRWGIKRT